MTPKRAATKPIDSRVNFALTKCEERIDACAEKADIAQTAASAAAKRVQDLEGHILQHATAIKLWNENINRLDRLCAHRDAPREVRHESTIVDEATKKEVARLRGVIATVKGDLSKRLVQLEESWATEIMMRALKARTKPTLRQRITNWFKE